MQRFSGEDFFERASQTGDSIKTVTETFVSANLKDVSGLVTGLFSEDEKDFLLGGVVNALSEIVSTSAAITRTTFSGTPAEFFEFCKGYQETDNCILVVRPILSTSLPEYGQVGDAGFEKCIPEAKMFPILSRDPGTKELTVMLFKKN